MLNSRLAHYEITALLGKGGMGEVYRARDANLGRDVALKILPPEFAADPERVARFEREARTLASLQHPDIAAIFGIERADGYTFLVMELCEGENLAERLARGPLPVDEATALAARLAGGIEAAHEKGIVHRDLKPANIILSPDGRLKILDFGLARAFEEQSPEGDVLNSPTLTAAFTTPGVILGTAAYMSPEQARGQAVDARADIWAFGVIVHEMLTGKRLFAGETVSDTLAAVLTRDPGLDALPDGVSPGLRHVLARCLERDPRRRLRAIGEARLLLADPNASALLTTAAAPAAVPARRRPLVLTLAPWLLLIAVLAAAAPRYLGGDAETDRPTRRFIITAELPRLYNSRAVELAPDGSRMAIYAKDGLWIRDMDSVEPRLLVPASELTNTETGITPFWSPDGQYVAYGSQNRLWRVSADGGAPQALCTLPGDWMGGAWGGDGYIVFCTGRGPMYRVSERGGDAELLLEPAPDTELDFHQPAWVADGGGFVYAVHRAEGVDTLELLRGGQRKVLLRVESAELENVQVVNNPVYSPTGHIVYQRDQGNRGLWALPFDARTGEAIGPPFLIASGMGHASVALDGTMVCTELLFIAPRSLGIVSREGEALENLTEPALGLGEPALAPDGQRIAYAAQNGQTTDIYLLDRRTGLANRLTASETRSNQPCWVPGSERIAFEAPNGTCGAIWVLDLAGGAPEVLVPRAQDPTFTPDARAIVYTTMCDRERGIAHRALDGDDDGDYLRQSSAGIDLPQLSPDGLFVCYRSWESGEPSLEVARYPGMDGRRQIALTESHARWSGDGKRLYYIARETAMMTEVELDLAGGVAVKASRELFPVAKAGVNEYGSFDVAPDGSFFVVAIDAVRATNGREITVVENWFGEFQAP